MEIEMLPLSFMEFCKVFKADEILNNIDLFGNDKAEKYKILYELYEVYKQIGGYPAIVSEYKKSKSIDRCMDTLKYLIDAFTNESAAYFKSDKCKIVFDNVYKAAFISMVSEKKGTASKEIDALTSFVKNSTKEHVSRTEVNDAISWLKYSKIIGSCDLYNQGNTMDLLSERRFYFMDCGVANCISKMTAVNNAAINGILTECFAYIELYRVDKTDVRYGIEIKTSNSNDPKTLNIYLNKKMIDKAYLAGKTKGGKRKEDNMYSIPIYTVGCRFPYNL